MPPLHVPSYFGDSSCVPADAHLIVVPPGGDGRRVNVRFGLSAALWRVLDPTLVAFARATYGRGEGRLHAPRRRVLLFRGSTRESTREGPSNNSSRECFNDEHSCSLAYSMGIRQTVRRLIGSSPLVDFSTRLEAAPRYHALLSRAEFCLTAPGFGFDTRIVDYIVAGCIPVIIQPTGRRLLLPYEPELRYDEFAVVVAYSDVRALPALVHNMSAAAIRAKRARLAEVHRTFVWDEEYGTAYEAVRDAVLGRLAMSNQREGPH